MNQMEASWLGLLEFAGELDPDPALAGLSDRDVERQVRDGASRIAAMTCQWLDHLAELVVRGVWADQGARTPGQWLSWACGEAGSTAREHVRVALALRHLPQIHARFAAGTLSYSKVRVLTKVAVPEIEADLLELADSAPASILGRLVAAGKRSADQWVRWQEGLPVDPTQVYDLGRVQIDPDTVELRVRLPRADALAVQERLDRLVDRADRTDRASEPAADQPAIPATGEGAKDGDGDAAAASLHRDARRAIALCDGLAVAVADDAPDRSGADDHLVVLHVDAAELAAAVTDHDPDEDPGDAAAADTSEGDAAAAGAADRSDGDAAAAGAAGQRRRAYVTTGRNRSMMLPRRVLARLTCDGDLRLAGSGQGHPADIGRRSRKVPSDLRRAVLLRDRHCRFPGCHRTRGLHAHHVLHWANGGPTDLDNLLLLCAHHHGFVHDHEWTLKPADPAAGRWTFHAPGQHQPLPAVLPMPGAAAASPTTPSKQPVPDLALQPPWWDGDSYDLNETVTMISNMLLDLAA